ncbi:hypothetical protein BY996DRAFT_6411704 [Phakopsora pachyrhizi]|nr:hypothetical protein BY996DRAFT_6411704 [Phakopsora pachyrhizi]
MLLILLLLPTLILNDGFVTKDCGLAPTVEELANFFKKQAADLAELAITNPCGFTSCPDKISKRQLDFVYSAKAKVDLLERRDVESHEGQQKDTLKIRNIYYYEIGQNQKRTMKRSTDKRRLLEAVYQPIVARADGTLYTHETKVIVPSAKKRGEPSQIKVLKRRQTLEADDQPTGARADGTLYTYGTEDMAPPAKKRGETSQRRVFKSRQTLEADDRATGARADGTLYAYGTEDMAPPAKKRGETSQRKVFKSRQTLEADDQETGARADGTLYTYGTEKMAAPA